MKKIKEVSSKMARLKLKTLREMNDQDLNDKLAELKQILESFRLKSQRAL